MAFGNLTNPGCGCCGSVVPPDRVPCSPPACPTIPRTIELSLSDLSDFLTAGTLTYTEQGVFPNDSGFAGAWWSDFIPYFESEAGHYNVLSCDIAGTGGLVMHIDDWQAGGPEETPIRITLNVITYTVPVDGTCDPLLLSAYSDIAGVTATVSG